MFRPSYKLLFVCLSGLFVLWAVAAALGLFGQRKLFYEGGREELYDYWMPRMCLEQGYVGHPERYQGLVDAKKREPIIIDDIDVLWSDWYTDGEKTFFITGWRDRVYPLFGILPLKPFPATRFGGYLWSGVAGLVFLASLCLISKSWWPLLLACSMPFLFNIERGNTTWLSAAFAGVFLAWWDDEKDWKQLAAAVCLAVAGGLKVTPFALGLIYFTKWRWRPVLLCGFLSAVFVFVPWMFMSDGLAEFSAMIRNAAAQSQFMQRGSDIGLVQLWRTVRIVLGQSVQEVWPGMKLVAVTSQLIGAAALIYGVCRRDKLLMVGGMLWAAGNMYYYAMLYMLPVFVLEFRGQGSGVRSQEPGVVTAPCGWARPIGKRPSRAERVPRSQGSGVVTAPCGWARPIGRCARAEGVGLAEAAGRAAKRSQEPARPSRAERVPSAQCVGARSHGVVMVEALLWLALLSPLQLVLLGHSANQVIGNLSLLGLMLFRMVRRVGEWRSCEWGS